MGLLTTYINSILGYLGIQHRDEFIHFRNQLIWSFISKILKQRSRYIQRRYISKTCYVAPPYIAGPWKRRLLIYGCGCSHRKTLLLPQHTLGCGQKHAWKWSDQEMGLVWQDIKRNIFNSQYCQIRAIFSGKPFN